MLQSCYLRSFSSHVSTSLHSLHFSRPLHSSNQHFATAINRPAFNIVNYLPCGRKVIEAARQRSFKERGGWTCLSPLQSTKSPLMTVQRKVNKTTSNAQTSVGLPNSLVCIVEQGPQPLAYLSEHEIKALVLDQNKNTESIRTWPRPGNIELNLVSHLSSRAAYHT